MGTPTSKAVQTPRDVGTLWTMCRAGHRSRCALLAWPDEWEVRILMDSVILLAQRCPRGGDAFRLGEQWKDRMLDRGWQLVLPSAPRHDTGLVRSVT